MGNKGEGRYIFQIFIKIINIIIKMNSNGKYKQGEAYF